MMTIAIYVITSICLLLLTLEAGYAVVKICTKKRPERIAFIRSFKMGKCIAIFLTAIPLIFLSYWDAGYNIFESVLLAVSHVFGLVVLRFGLDDIPGLIGSNLFYKIVVYYCCVLVTINAIIFALSLVSQRLWRWKEGAKIKYTSKDKLYIFGHNQNSLSIYDSEKTRRCAIVDNISAGDRATLYTNKTAFISSKNLDGVIDGIFKRLSKKTNKTTVVINTEDDEKNIRLGWLFCNRIKQADEQMQQRLFDRLSVYVFGDPKYEAIYDEIVSGALGCVHYKNKYRMIAMNFIEKYPFTKFMDERHIDYSTGLLKKDVDVNVCMIGFGKPNQQIFLTSVANNQFLAAGKNGVGLKQVNYHIFDKAPAENNKGLNHSYYRFRNECADVKKNEYLPLPELPAHEKYYHIDINEPAFYNNIREIVTAKKSDANFVIVSFDSDLDNIDMAQKLVAKRREWGDDDLVIFVRVKTDHGDNSLFADDNVFAIGKESESVFDISEITNDDIYQMAQMRNEVYALERKITSEDGFVVNEASVLQNNIEARRNWFIKQSQLERESNLYCCLSLQSKLNLIGLEYCKAGDNDLPALTEDEYLEAYAGDDMPNTKYYNLTVGGKKIIKYGLEFPDSRRKNMTILEHLRWNSFMISRGMIPASKAQILGEKLEKDGELKYSNGKNYGLRRHGNLTTFEGLEVFRKMIAERDGESEAKSDVIKYDYQLLDDAHWLLTKNGFKIVKRPR